MTWKIEDIVTEIQRKKGKAPIHFYFGIIPLTILLIFIVIHELKIVKVEESYTEEVVYNKFQGVVYKVSESNIRLKKKKPGFIADIFYGDRFNYIETIDSTWYKIKFNADTGLIKMSDSKREKANLSKRNIRRYQVNSGKKIKQYGIAFASLITLTGCLFFLNKKRRPLYLNYEFNQDIINFNKSKDSFFNELSSDDYIWLIDKNFRTSMNENLDYFSNLNREKVEVLRDFPPNKQVISNLPIPAIKLKDNSYHFFPDGLIKNNNGKFSFFTYKEASIEYSDLKFLETGHCSKSAIIVEYQLPSKNNIKNDLYPLYKKIPICLYSCLKLYQNKELEFVLLLSRHEHFSSLIHSKTKQIHGDQFKDETIVNNDNYFDLIKTFANRIKDIYLKLKNSKEFLAYVESISKNLKANELESVTQYCFLYDISKIFNLIKQEYGTSINQDISFIITLTTVLNKIDSDILRLSQNALNDLYMKGSLTDLYNTYLGFGQKENPLTFEKDGVKADSNKFSLIQLLEVWDANVKDGYQSALYRLALLFTKADGNISGKEQQILKEIYSEIYMRENMSNNSMKKDDGQKQISSESLEDALNELEGLIGLQGVKEEVSSLVNFIQFQSKREKQGLKTNEISYHCVFAGSPGTGKTTVARILAKVYKHLGVIDNGIFIETDRSGLVAEYVGQTAVKVSKLVDRCLGGVLFIDEAYSLASSSDEDFGKEAISTLIKLMEDRRDNFIVIVAGYSDKMHDFIDTNPGLRSRFNRYLHFEDYNPDELLKIFIKMCDSSDYKIEPETMEYLKIKFTEAFENRDKTFGNARLVRNIFEKSIENMSNRISAHKILTKDTLSIIKKEDIEF